jgi:hypothetical protein
MSGPQNCSFKRPVLFIPDKMTQFHGIQKCSENRFFLCMVLLENIRFWRTVLSDVRFSTIKVKVFAETGVQGVVQGE